MRRLLIHHAGPLSAKAQKVPVWDDVKCVDEGGLAEVESLLSRLEAMKPMFRTIGERWLQESGTRMSIEDGG